MRAATVVAPDTLRRAIDAAPARLARSGALCAAYLADEAEWLASRQRVMLTTHAAATVPQLPVAAVSSLAASAHAPLTLAGMRFLVEQTPGNVAPSAASGVWVDAGGDDALDIGAAADATDQCRRRRRAMVARSYMASAPMLEGRVEWAAGTNADTHPTGQRLRWADAERRVHALEAVISVLAMGAPAPLLSLLPGIVGGAAALRLGTVVCMPVRDGAHWMLLAYATAANVVAFFDPKPSEHRFCAAIVPLVAAMRGALALLPADAALAPWDAAQAAARCPPSADDESGFYVAYVAQRLMTWRGVISVAGDVAPTQPLDAAQFARVHAQCVAACGRYFATASNGGAALRMRRAALQQWVELLQGGAHAQPMWRWPRL